MVIRHPLSWSNPSTPTRSSPHARLAWAVSGAVVEMITSDWAHPAATAGPVSTGADAVGPDAWLRGLVRRSGRGDQDAFAVFYASTVAYVTALLRACQTVHVVDDLVVATYVALWKHARRVDLDRIGVWSWVASEAHVAVRHAIAEQVHGGSRSASTSE